MAEVTRVSPEEVKRREDFLRVNQQPRWLLDPYTWSYPWKGAALLGSISIGLTHFYNLFKQKPWYYAIYPRTGAIAFVSLIGYGMGVMRERHHRIRDAIVEHYIQEHPSDFERQADIYGRPYSNVLLPWYPRRTAYPRYD